MDDLLYLASLHRLPGMTHVRLRRLFKEGLSWKTLWDNPHRTLGILSLPLERQEQMRSAWKEPLLLSTQHILQKTGCEILYETQPHFPFLLTHIAQAPFVLYVLGQVSLLSCPSIAIVGTRKLSHYGRDILTQVIPSLVKKDVLVVSGLALGTDLEAQKLVVQHGGKTIGVLGSGIDVLYPVSAQKCARDLVVGGGAIVSDFPLGTCPEPYHFPLRNRLIAGLVQAVVVIEAGEKSGSVITAHLALEQGKDVYAFPGSVFSHESQGTNQLIAKGEAQLLSTPSDLFTYLGIQEGNSALVKKGPEEELRVLYVLCASTPIEEQELYAAYGQDLSLFHMHLSLLEMEGFVEKVEGTKWKRKI